MQIRLPRASRAGAAFVLSLSLAFALLPSVDAWATVEGDQSISPSAADIAAAVASGEIAAGDDGAYASPERLGALAGGLAPASARDDFAPQVNEKVPSPVSVYGYAGDSMYETAAAEALAAHPDGSRSAIIAGPGEAWVDALSAAGLAATRGPILFSETERMNASTLSALRELGVSSVIVVGGILAVSDRAVDDLADAGIALERRLSGSDAYATQLEIYRYGREQGLWNPSTIVYATGTSFGDALSVSPVAYAEKAPVFLVDSSRDFTDEQRRALIDGARAGFGAQGVVVGGRLSVSDFALGFADYVSALAGGDGKAVRLWGENQYDTSAAIASWAVENKGFTWDAMAFSAGTLPYDALAGSVLQGASKSVLLLADDYDAATIAAAGGARGQVKSVRFLGGEYTLPVRVRMGVADALGFPYAAIPGFKVYVDAGHGPDGVTVGVFDPGAVSGGYREYDLTKDLAGRVTRVLRDEYGVDVYLNDNGGRYWLRHAEAVNVGADALVSIHFNASMTHKASGTESYIHDTAASPLSAGWQARVHAKLAAATGLPDLGMKKKELAITSGYLPAVLLEVCFIDNASDMETYEENRDAVAHGIAEGIVS